MQVGIFAKTFQATSIVDVFRSVRLAGYKTCQFNMACAGLSAMPEEITPALAVEIARVSAAEGIGIAAVSGTYNMAHPDEQVRNDGLRRLGVIIGAARAMGTSLVSLCTGSRDREDQWRFHPDNSSAEAWRDMVASMQQALELAEAHDVSLGIEPELANVVSDAVCAHRLLEELKSPRLKIILDPANLFEHASDDRLSIIAQAVDLLGPHLAMAHAKDRDATGKFVAAGTGIIDFTDFIARLKAAGFKGPLITHGLGEEDAKAVARLLTRLVAG